MFRLTFSEAQDQTPRNTLGGWPETFLEKGGGTGGGNAGIEMVGVLFTRVLPDLT